MREDSKVVEVFSIFGMGVSVVLVYALIILVGLLSLGEINLAFADMTTWAVSEDCVTGSTLYKNKAQLQISAGSAGCGLDTSAACSAELANSDYSNGGCSCSAELTQSCSVVIFHICCSPDWVTARQKMEDVNGASITVTGVPVGQEKDAADVVWTNFDVQALYPSHDDKGMNRTDGIGGYVYTSELEGNNNTSTVKVEAWKRAGYAPEGATYSIQNITGSGGGTSAVGVETGVTNALNAQNKDASGNPFTPDSLQGFADSTASVLSKDTTSFPTSYDNVPQRDSLTARVTAYLEGNPLISIVKQSAVTASGGSCTLTAANAFGGQDITMDFCSWGPYMSGFGTVVLVAASLYAFFIMTGRA